MSSSLHPLPLILLLTAGLLGGQPLAGQQQPFQITGTVVERATGDPIQGVIVSLEGTDFSALTDDQGTFLLSVPVPPGTYNVQFRFIGLRVAPREVVLGPQRTVNLGRIALQEAPLGLDEIVVTGTATPTERRAVPNAVESVPGAAIRDAPGVATVDQALQGKVTGAVISENSGQPGGGVSIRLRGTSSILGGAEPLIVVDGVIIDNSTEALISLGANAGRGGASLTNRLADIAPEDVERIEVVKGAAAAALYGSRANNGVIQIFTRRGAQGAPRYSISTEMFVEETPDRLDLNLEPRAVFADVLFAGADSVGAPIDRFDYQDRLFQTGTGTSTALTVSGGQEGTTWFLSGSYKDTEGIMRATGHERISARARLVQALGERVEVSVGANLVHSDVDFVPEGEQTQGLLTAVVFGPTAFDPSFDPDAGRFPFHPILGANPLSVIENWDAAESVLRFTGNLETVWRPMDGLELRYLYGLDDYRQANRYFRPPQAESVTFPGIAQNPLRLSRQQNHDVTVNYTLPVGDDLALTTTAGTRYTEDDADVIRAAAEDLPPGQRLVGGATQFASQFVSELRTFGAFIQEQVAFRDRLYLTGALNVEGSSAFGTDERWQLFPKLGVSWVVSDEPFWRESLGDRLFSSLKLRSAYGETGGQPPGLYARFENFVDIGFAGLPGLVPSSLAGNPDLKPERQREIEAGFEAGFLDDRVSAVFSYYDKQTTDLVLSVPLPATSGRSNQFQNIGEISNRGVELALHTLNIEGSRLQWRSTLQYASNRNRVEKLVTEADTLLIPGGGYPNAVIEGQPVGVFYGGIYARDSLGNIIHDEEGRAFRARDTLPDGSTPFAQRIVGDPNPDFTLAFGNTLQLGENFELSMLLDGRFGNDVMNFTRRITEFFGTAKITELEARGDTASRVFVFNPHGRIGVYEEYAEDGSFLKLREIAVSYRFTQPFVRRLGANSLRLRVAGRNLKTWTDYTGLDPEVNLFAANTVARGVDFATVPLPRRLVIGIHADF